MCQRCQIVSEPTEFSHRKGQEHGQDRQIGGTVKEPHS